MRYWVICEHVQADTYLTRDRKLAQTSKGAQNREVSWCKRWRTPFLSCGYFEEHRSLDKITSAVCLPLKLKQKQNSTVTFFNDHRLNVPGNETSILSQPRRVCWKNKLSKPYLSSAAPAKQPPCLLHAFYGESSKARLFEYCLAWTTYSAACVQTLFD